MDIEYHHFDDQQPPPSAHLEPILELMERVLGGSDWLDAAALLDELRAHRVWLVSVAYAGSTLVGFKIGHRERAHRLRSWLGGVHPDWRRRGIARTLMRAQHDWCRRRGFTTVRTVTSNQYKPMLLLNLLTGFDIIGVRCDEGQPKLQLQLELDPEPSG